MCEPVPGLDRSLAEPPDPQPWPDGDFEDMQAYDDDAHTAIAHLEYAYSHPYPPKPALPWNIKTTKRGVDNGEVVILIECRTPFNSDVANAQPVMPDCVMPACQHTADVNRFVGIVEGQGDFRLGTFRCSACNALYQHRIDQAAFDRLKDMCRQAILEGISKEECQFIEQRIIAK